MTTEETKAGNKLIAEFMGIHTKKSWMFGAAYGLYHPSGLPCMKWNGMRTEEAIWETFLQGKLYHNSWEWLMPVVGKIESMGRYYTVQILKDRCVISIGTVKDSLFHGFKEGHPKIISTWMVVVEFVKWHNKQQSNQKTETK